MWPPPLGIAGELPQSNWTSEPDLLADIDRKLVPTNSAITAITPMSTYLWFDAAEGELRKLVDGIKIKMDKQRARDSLVATDFYDDCGHMPGVHVSEISIPKGTPIASDADPEKIA